MGEAFNTLCELWDTANMSIIDEYATLEAVLEDVREEMVVGVQAAVGTWGVLRYEGNGPRVRVAVFNSVLSMAAPYERPPRTCRGGRRADCTGDRAHRTRP